MLYKTAPAFVIPVENVTPGRLWTMLTGLNVGISVLDGKKIIAEYVAGIVIELSMAITKSILQKLNEN
jgi:hypothetical protein